MSAPLTGTAVFLQCLTITRRKGGTPWSRSHRRRVAMKNGYPFWVNEETTPGRKYKDLSTRLDPERERDPATQCKLL